MLKSCCLCSCSLIDVCIAVMWRVQPIYLCVGRSHKVASSCQAFLPASAATGSINVCMCVWLYVCVWGSTQVLINYVCVWECELFLLNRCPAAPPLICSAHKRAPFCSSSLLFLLHFIFCLSCRGMHTFSSAFPPHWEVFSFCLVLAHALCPRFLRCTSKPPNGVYTI